MNYNYFQNALYIKALDTVLPNIYNNNNNNAK